MRHRKRLPSYHRREPWPLHANSHRGTAEEDFGNTDKTLPEMTQIIELQKGEALFLPGNGMVQIADERIVLLPILFPINRRGTKILLPGALAISPYKSL